MSPAGQFVSTARRPVCAALPWALVLSTLVGLYAITPNFRSRDGAAAAPLGGDFLQEWIGGYIIRRGEADRLYDPDYAKRLQHDPDVVGYRWRADRYLPIVYPPFYYLLVSPLAALNSATATAVWAGLMVGALCLTLLLWQRLARFDTATLGWVALAVLLFPPLVENMISSQKGTLILLLFTASYALLRAGWPMAAGLVFGLIAFKPQLALLVAFAMLFKRQWRFVLGGATTGMLLALLSLAASWQACEDYVRFALGTGNYLQTAGYDLTKAHNWRGFFALMLGEQAPPLVVTLATLSACAATIFLVARLLAGRLDTNSPNFARQFAGMVIGTVLVSPHLLTYDLTVLLPVFLLATGPNRVPKLAIVLFAACAVSAPLALACGVQISVFVLAVALTVLMRERWQAHEAGAHRVRSAAISAALSGKYPCR